MTHSQRYAVAKLTGYAEGIIKSGILGEEWEAKLREQVVVVCNEFGMPVYPANDDSAHEALRGLDAALNEIRKTGEFA